MRAQEVKTVQGGHAVQIFKPLDEFISEKMAQKVALLRTNA
jgi:hypothetical protein